MTGKRELALHGHVAVIQNRIQEHYDCQSNAQANATRQKIPLDERKNGRKKRHRAEDGKVCRSEELEIGWHVASEVINPIIKEIRPLSRRQSWMGARFSQALVVFEALC